VDAINAFKNYLAAYFPSDQYGKNPSIVAHYLVFNGGNANKASLEQWLSKPDKVAQRVGALVTRHKLNLLHMACMLGREEAAALVLKADVLDINAKDARGWTALHFAAAVNNVALMTLLQQHGAQPLKNNLGAAPADITRMVYTRKDPREQRFFYADDGKVMEGDGVQFSALTGADSYADDDVRVSPALQVKRWAESDAWEDNPLWFTEKYEQFRASAWEENFYVEKADGVGFEVVLRRPVKAEDYIGEYLGEVMEEDPMTDFEQFLEDKSADYSIGPISARKHRSLVSMINDGFPTVMCSTSPPLRGREFRSVLVALEDLPAGTVLRFNYGIGHRCKFGPHREADLEKAAAFYAGIRKKGFSLEERLYYLLKKNNEQLEKNGKVHIDINCERNRFVYLAETPALIVHLAINGIVPVKELIDLWLSPYVQKYVVGSGHGFTSYLMSQLLVALRQAEPSIRNLSEGQRAEISAATETMPIHEVVELIRKACPDAGIKPMDLKPPRGAVVNPLYEKKGKS